MTASKIAFFRTKDKGHIKFDSKGAQKRYNSCERKGGFTNAVANQIIRERTREGIFLFTYLCKHCNKWHLTHKQS